MVWTGCLLPSFSVDPLNSLNRLMLVSPLSLSLSLVQSSQSCIGGLTIENILGDRLTLLSFSRCHCDRPLPSTHLHLEHGAAVRRLILHSDAITPVLRVAQFGCRLTGDGGVVVSDNPSPRGVVNLGPTAMPPYTPHEHDVSKSTLVSTLVWRVFHNHA